MYYNPAAFSFSYLCLFQEAAYIKIHAELPDVLTNYAQPVNTKVYPTWEKFIKSYLSKGWCFKMHLQLFRINYLEPRRIITLYYARCYSIVVD